MIENYELLFSMTFFIFYFFSIWKEKKKRAQIGKVHPPSFSLLSLFTPIKEIIENHIFLSHFHSLPLSPAKHCKNLLFLTPRSLEC